MKVLIAHPNASYLEVTKHMLRAQGGEFDLEGVTSVDECLNRLSRENYDVLLIDSDLARGETERFIATIKSISKSIPIILTIDENYKEIIDRAAELGVYDWVVKRKGYLSSLPVKLQRAVQGWEKQQREDEGEGKKEEFSKEDEEVQKDVLLNQGYFICDRKGRFLSANHFIQELSGYSEEELLELTITDLMSKDNEREFYEKILNTSSDSMLTIPTIIVDKIGEKHPVELRIKVLREDGNDGEVIGFRGNIVVIPEDRPELPTQRGRVDQSVMISELMDIVHLSYTEPLNVILKRIAEVVCQIFGFQRSTVALLDRRKKAFVKQAMVGYSTVDSGSIERRAIEVPQEVIDRIFADRFKIKVIYYTQDQRESRDFISPGVPERRTQRRRPGTEWHKRDLILLNLSDYRGNTFGYISLDEPEEGNVPTRSTFHNLELFSKLVSMVIENFYRFSTLERRNRRLKQVLVSSNIFKLYLSLSELLKEVVWSVKFSLDFNLVSLVLISKKTGLLETKAVACDDKIKLLQIKELKFDLKDFGELLKDEYRQGKSYLITEEEKVLSHFKRIYYGSQTNGRYEGGWPYWALLLVPIKSREGKIIGFLMADDPQDCRMPNAETIQIMEILANQIAIAIDNRVMYVQAKEQIKSEQEEKDEESEDEFYDEDVHDDDYVGGGLKKLVERFLR